MPKGSSGYSGGTWEGESSGGNSRPMNIQLAGTSVMRDIANALSRGATEFPEIRSYANISEIREGNFRDGTLGTIDNHGRITVQRGLPSGGGQNSREWVAAHEVGHGLTRNPPQGYRTAEQTMQAATREYNRGRATGRLTQAGLAGRVSTYARKSPREAVAEAFADWTINGRNARIESQIIMRNWRR